MVKLVRIPTLIVFPLVVEGCGGDTGPVGPAGPSLTGTLNGSVTLYLENGAPETNHGGVSVWIEGGADSTLTDSLGRWKLEGIKTGIYSLVMQKAGYGYTKIPQVQFVGGGDLFLGNRALSRDPSFTVTTLYFSFSYVTENARVGGAISPTAASDRSVVIFLGHQAIVATDPLTYVDTLVAAVYANTIVFNSALFQSRSSPYNFSTGDSMHILACPLSGTLGGYVDPISDRMVFTTGIADSGYAWTIIAL